MIKHTEHSAASQKNILKTFLVSTPSFSEENFLGFPGCQIFKRDGFTDLGGIPSSAASKTPSFGRQKTDPDPTLIQFNPSPMVTI